MKNIVLTQKNRLKLPKVQLEFVRLLSYYSARLYNVGLYSVRQHFFENKEYLNYAKNYHTCKHNENYKLLLTDTAQQILKLVERNMKSFFKLLKLQNTGKYENKVRLPGYKDKEALGIVIIQGRSARIKNGYVYIGFSKAFKDKHSPPIKDLVFKLPKSVNVKKLQEVRIIPIANGKEFDIEFVYKKEIKPLSLNSQNHLSIDLGLDNFATCFDSTDGSFFIVDGRYIKSINQRYNKENARLQSIKDHQKHKHTTDRMLRLNRKRYFRINDYFNRVVKNISDYCMEHDIGTIVVGDFKDIKREIKLGKRNNQNFVSIPYGIFKRKLKFKCEQLGIGLHSIEESYTSKCSFLDMECVEKHESYLGKRVKRGLFRTAKGILVNADVNGSANILYKFLKSKHRLEELNFERVSKGFVTNPCRSRPKVSYS